MAVVVVIVVVERESRRVDRDFIFYLFINIYPIIGHVRVVTSRP